jgi:hypothetical protein
MLIRLPVERTDGARIGDLLATCDAIIERVEVKPVRQFRREQMKQICWKRRNTVASHLGLSYQ